MKPSLLKVALTICLRTKNVPFIWGAPGVGKTDLVYQIAPELGFDSIIVIPANSSDPIEQRGIPYVDDDKRTSYALSKIWPTSGKHLIYIDEYNTAPLATQNTFYPLLWGGKMNGGEYVLPPESRLIAAGNRQTDRVHVFQMTTASGSRFSHYDFDIDYQDWHRWGVTHGIHPKVLFFHKFRSYEWLWKFDPTKNDRTFPCPRTWEKVSNIRHQNPPMEVAFDMYRAEVHDAAAVEFIGFERICDGLIPPDMILLKPNDVQIPENPATLYAVSAGVAHLADKGNMQAVCAFADRLPEEFGSFLVNTVISLKPKTQQTAAFQQFMASHPDILN